jgi:hypothetical protein
VYFILCHRILRNLTKYSAKIEFLTKETFSSSQLLSSQINFLEFEMKKNEYLVNSKLASDAIDQNTLEAMEAIETLRGYFDFLTNGLIKIEDISIEDFEKLAKEYEMNLEKLKNEWNCDSPKIDEFCQNYPEIDQYRGENDFSQLCATVMFFFVFNLCRISIIF